jgi:hypothetical protein
MGRKIMHEIGLIQGQVREEKLKREKQINHTETILLSQNYITRRDALKNNTMC